MRASLPWLALGLVAATLAPTAAAEPRCIPGLTATANGDGTITLDWPAVNATAYQVVERATAPNATDWTPLNPQVPGAGTGFTFTGEAGTTYEFAVVALSGPSQPYGTYCSASATAGPSVQPPPCPANVTATVGSTSVRIAWDLVPGADGYNVVRDDGDASPFLGHVNATTNHVDDTLPGPATRTYLVTATSGAAQSQGCVAVQVTQVPDLGTAPSLVAAALATLGAAFVVAWRRA